MELWVSEVSYTGKHLKLLTVVLTSEMLAAEVGNWYLHWITFVGDEDKYKGIEGLKKRGGNDDKEEGVGGGGRGGDQWNW